LMGMLAVGILAIMMLFTVADVCLRYFFNHPIFGSLEITVFLMICVGCLGLGWAATTGMHVKVDLVVSRYPPRVQTIINAINYICVIAVCALVAWRGFRESLATIRYDLSSDSLNVPFYPFYWVLVFGYVVLMLVIITLLIRTLRKAK
jgi:TRAP-type C4-dicarboxylate transport system permease small subunit